MLSCYVLFIVVIPLIAGSLGCWEKEDDAITNGVRSLCGAYVLAILDFQFLPLYLNLLIRTLCTFMCGEFVDIRGFYFYICMIVGSGLVQYGIIVCFHLCTSKIFCMAIHLFMQVLSHTLTIGEKCKCNFSLVIVYDGCHGHLPIMHLCFAL